MGVPTIDRLHADNGPPEPGGVRTLGPLDDQAKAQEVTSQLSYVNGEISKLGSLRSRLDDAQVLLELAEAESDPGVLTEVETEIAGLGKAIEEMEVRTLLSGEYDSREALVAIRAGAGGVDAADCAEMLLRMYLRWAERPATRQRSTRPRTPRRRA